MLYVPLVSQQALDGNVGFHEFFALSDRLRQAGEDIFWYVLIPSWVKDGLKGHNRMQYVYLDNTRDHVVNDVVGFPAFETAEYFARRGGKFIVDGVLSNCVEFSSYLSHLLSDPVKKRTMPVFVRDHGEQTAFTTRETPEQWLLAVSNYVGCHVGVRSHSERYSLARTVSINTNAAMSSLFARKSFLWPVGYDLDRVDSVVSESTRKMDGLPVFFCGGDFDLSKNKRRELKIARELYATGVAQTLVTSVSARYKIERALPQGDSSFIKVIEAQARPEHYELALAKAHVFVSVARAHDTLAAEEELGRLLYGQVGVFPHQKWFSMRLGEDYPFYYTTEHDEEAFILAEWIAKNYEDAVGRIEPMVQKLREAQSLETSVAEGWEAMQMWMSAQYHVNEMKPVTDKPTLFQTVYKVATGLGVSFNLDVFLDILEEHLPWLKAWGRKGSLKVLGDVPQALPTLYDIREMLDNLGWVDTCDGPDIMIRRVREPLPGVCIERLEETNE